jgi:hypothetical protein
MSRCYGNAATCTAPALTDVRTKVALRARTNACLTLKTLCNKGWDDTFWDAQDACASIGGEPINPNTCDYN